MSIVIAEKIDLKIRKMTRDSLRRIIGIKRSTHQDDITIVSACTPKRTSKYIKQEFKKWQN